MKQQADDDPFGRLKSKPPRFKLKPFDATKISITPNYLIKGILPRSGLVVVWGPPKCGKSFWTFDLVMHVAVDREYRGHKVHGGAVVYLALEGGSGFAARIEAWRRHHLADHRGAVPFYLIDVAVNLVADRNALIAAIREQLAGQRVVTIVIDTLNRSLAGSENKDEDMAAYIRAADAIRAAFDCTVIIIHHCGTAGNRPRGHTSLSGASRRLPRLPHGDLARAVLCGISGGEGGH
jgi:RecA-family ATPase